MTKRVTNAEIAELLAKVEAALGIPAPVPESATSEPPTTFSREDHDALVTLVAKMEFVEKAAKRWDDNHTVVSNLQQRVSLISWFCSIVAGGAICEGIRRLVNHYFV